MNKILLMIFTSAWLGIAHGAVENPIGAMGGVSLDRTRLILSDGKQSVGIGIANKNPVPMVVTSWVVDVSGQPSEKFVTTPSIFQIGPNKAATASIRLVDKLPEDRESVFWLKVNAAMAGETDSNVLSAAIGQKIKIFYRPKGLKGDARFAATKLIWSYKDGQLIASNPTGITVSISDLIFDGKATRVAKMILPFSSYNWNVKKSEIKSLDKKFTFIDEYGGFYEVNFKVGNK